MPCASAFVKNLKTLSPEQDVREALALFRTQGYGFAPVLDGKGLLIGCLSLHQLLKALLPISLELPAAPRRMSEYTVKAAPGIAKRLKKIKPQKVGDWMERRMTIVHPETPLWEGVAKMVESGTPALVVEEKTGRFLGMMDELSAMQELERLNNEDEES